VWRDFRTDVFGSPTAPATLNINPLGIVRIFIKASLLQLIDLLPLPLPVSRCATAVSCLSDRSRQAPPLPLSPFSCLRLPAPVGSSCWSSRIAILHCHGVRLFLHGSAVTCASDVSRTRLLFKVGGSEMGAVAGRVEVKVGSDAVGVRCRKQSEQH
jgi:hypothetical protein